MSTMTSEEIAKERRSHEEYWTAIPTLPRKYLITLQDVGVGEYCGLATNVTPESLSQALGLTGGVERKARKGVEYLKDYLLELMRYDDEIWKLEQARKKRPGIYRWQTGIIPSGAGSGAPHILHNHWINEVNNHFEDVLEFIRFFVPSQARKRYMKRDANSADALLDEKLSSDMRKHALDHMNKWKERYTGGSKDKGKAPSVAAMTIPSLRSMTRGELFKLVKEQNIDWQAVGKKHDINTPNVTQLRKEHLVTILSDHNGLLGQFEAEEA